MKSWKKKVALVLMGLAFTISSNVFAEDMEYVEESYNSVEEPAVIEWTPPAASLEANEVLVFGRAGQGSIIDRLDRVDQALLGATQTGTVISRTQKQAERLRGGSQDNLSVLARVNASEWSLDKELSLNPLERRLADLEMRLTGKVSNYSLETRSKEVASHVVEDQTGVLVTIPSRTLVLVEFVDPLSSRTAQVGDKGRIKVAEDVFVDGHLVFPKGALGQVTVKEVKPAKTASRNGKLLLNFDYVETLDGTQVHLIQGEEAMEASAVYAKEPGNSKKVIVGQAVTVSGAFFNSENAVAKEGDQLYIETNQEYQVFSTDLQ